jgi:hypothetical protein
LSDTVKWLIDPNFSQIELLVEAIEKSGSQIKYMKPRSPLDELHYQEFDAEDCVIIYGSMKHVAYYRNAPWAPGLFCDTKALQCTNYYSAVGDALFNDDYVIAPIGDLLRLWPLYINMFGRSEGLFIRPNSSLKPFTGTVIDYTGWELCQEYWVKDLGPDALVVVSTPKEVLTEWRVVVVDGKVVTGCQYSHRQKHREVVHFPNSVRSFVQHILDSGFAPQEAYVMDVAETKNGELAVMEINSFSCAGLYVCDHDAIVDAMNALARKMWADLRP